MATKLPKDYTLPTLDNSEEDAKKMKATTWIEKICLALSTTSSTACFTVGGLIFVSIGSVYYSEHYATRILVGLFCLGICYCIDFLGCARFGRSAFRGWISIALGFYVPTHKKLEILADSFIWLGFFLITLLSSLYGSDLISAIAAKDNPQNDIVQETAAEAIARERFLSAYTIELDKAISNKKKKLTDLLGGKCYRKAYEEKDKYYIQLAADNGADEIEKAEDGKIKAAEETLYKKRQEWEVVAQQNRNWNNKGKSAIVERTEAQNSALNLIVIMLGVASCVLAALLQFVDSLNYCNKQVTPEMLLYWSERNEERKIAAENTATSSQNGGSWHSHQRVKT